MRKEKRDNIVRDGLFSIQRGLSSIQIPLSRDLDTSTFPSTTSPTPNFGLPARHCTTTSPPFWMLPAHFTCGTGSGGIWERARVSYLRRGFGRFSSLPATLKVGLAPFFPQRVFFLGLPQPTRKIASLRTLPLSGLRLYVAAVEQPEPSSLQIRHLHPRGSSRGVLVLSTTPRGSD